MTDRAPIAVFAYNRPDHLSRTLGALRACEGFDAAHVTVFVDGPRTPEDAAPVSAAREVAREMLGPAAEVRAAERNRGLARSIVSGVGELVAAHGRVIVVEDDLELAPGFLAYMNAALARYTDDEAVHQVSGHMFEVPEFAERREALFLPMTTTWGWATWARAWSGFDPDAPGWERLLADRALRRRFNLGGVYDYTAMMRRQMSGRADSWGIRWYWSVFNRSGLTLFPPRSLVRNIGQDGSGTHGGGVLADFSGAGTALPSGVPALPEMVAVDQADFAAVTSAIWKQNGGWPGWALGRARALLGK